MLTSEEWLKTASVLSGFVSSVVAKSSEIKGSQEGSQQCWAQGAKSHCDLPVIQGTPKTRHEDLQSDREATLVSQPSELIHQARSWGGPEETCSHTEGVSPSTCDIPLEDVKSNAGVDKDFVSAPSTGQRTVEGVAPEHLVVLVHGVSGEPECFTVLQQTLQNQLAQGRVLLVASKTNRKGWSHDGVEACGLRLAEEVKELIEVNPSMKRISFVAYSIGGLFVRYACGREYDPSTRKIFGLEPCHFVSIATPHLGCHVEGESQVPFIGWGLRLPGMYMVLKPIFDLLAAPVTRLMYGMSGRNLFLEDGDASNKPVIMKLVYDLPEEGYFFSALSQFKIRVCYANAVGDALVGWANASIRKEEELPWKQCDNLEYMGVVHEAPLHIGCWGEEKHTRGFAHAKGMSSDWEHLHDNLSFATKRQAIATHVLSRLQALPWCRIDIAIKNTFMAHTNIIVARESMDSIGIPVVEHIAHRFCELDQLIGF